jgi:hypothetical protein
VQEEAATIVLPFEGKPPMDKRTLLLILSFLFLLTVGRNNLFSENKPVESPCGAKPCKLVDANGNCPKGFHAQVDCPTNPRMKRPCWWRCVQKKNSTDCSTQPAKNPHSEQAPAHLGKSLHSMTQTIPTRDRPAEPPAIGENESPPIHHLRIKVSPCGPKPDPVIQHANAKQSATLN